MSSVAKTDARILARLLISKLSLTLERDTPTKALVEKLFSFLFKKMFHLRWLIEVIAVSEAEKNAVLPDKMRS